VLSGEDQHGIARHDGFQLSASRCLAERSSEGAQHLVWSFATSKTCRRSAIQPRRDIEGNSGASERTLPVPAPCHCGHIRRRGGAAVIGSTWFKRLSCRGDNGTVAGPASGHLAGQMQNG
jgi:hypothetical protein